MKYICNHCGKQYPACIVEVTGMVPEPPYSCLYAEDAGDMAADWKEMKERDFEMNGICADCSNSGCSCSDCDDASGFSNEDAIKSHVDTAISENVRSDAEIKDKDYRQESIVSKNKIKIEEMIDAHWSYIESVIRTSNEYGLYMPPMSLDDALKIREFDYKTAAKHFYGHGHEDGVIEMAKKTVERLRK